MAYNSQLSGSLSGKGVTGRSTGEKLEKKVVAILICQTISTKQNHPNKEKTKHLIQHIEAKHFKALKSIILSLGMMMHFCNAS